MNFPALDILHACAEAESRRLGMLPLIASVLGVPPDEVWNHWAFRRCVQCHHLPGTAWRTYFHGLECDLINADGRLLRYDFGPGGRIDTFTAWGVFQFIMTSVAPWPEFPAMKRRYTGEGPPDSSYGNYYTTFLTDWERLEEQGCFAIADPALITFQQRYTTIGSDGIARIAYPPDTPERTQVDCSVAHRVHLSEVGRRLLAAAPLAPDAGAGAPRESATMAPS